MGLQHPIDRICTIEPGTKEEYTYYPVAVIGGGESGICVGAQLQRELKFDQFRIFERRAGLGGTWHANRYPGIACDVPALCYSFSFAQNPNWTGILPPGAEILSYLHDVCAKFKLLDKIQCNVNVKSIKWIEADEQWEVTLEHLADGVGNLATAERAAIEAEKGIQATVVRLEKVRAKVVFGAAGGLVEPKPNLDVPGSDTFEGRVVHTARWDDTIELKDKNVVVVGTGCSAAQILPQMLTPKFGPVKHVTQLLRSPPWTIPLTSPEVKDWFANTVPKLSRRIPGFQNLLRKWFMGMFEFDWYSHFDITDAALQRRRTSGEKFLAYMREHVPEEYHEILTPDYELYCKRRIIDDGWLDSLRDERVDITSLPLTSMSPDSVTLGPGRNYPPQSRTDSKVSNAERTVPCDILVLANGYQTNEWLHPLDVTGRAGKSLAQTWKEQGGARAYLGIAMPSFPNFFMIFGPNTATGHTSVILASENMTNYSLKFVEPILRGDATTAEIKPSAEKQYTERVQSELRKSLYTTGGCVNWYVDRESGWNSTVYPRSQIDHTIRCMFPLYWHWTIQYTRQGYIKLWLNRLSKLLFLVGIILGARQWRTLGTAGVKQQWKIRSYRVKMALIQRVMNWMQ